MSPQVSKNANPSDAESVARKKAIVERQAAGEPVAKIAADLGVSRAYAYYILKEVRERGEGVVKKQGRGKPKDKALTREQSKTLIKTLQETQPWEHGIDSGMWSEAEAKEWFLGKFKRSISVGQVRQIGIKHKIRMRPLTAEEWKQIPRIPTESDGPEEELEIPSSPQQVADLDDWESDADLDMDAIKRSVAETRKSLSKKRISYGGPQTGIRTGKHSKQRVPQTKKKKRRK